MMISKVRNASGLAARSLRLLDLLGIDATRLWLVVRGFPKYVRDCRRYRRSAGPNSLKLNFRDLQPVLWESREPGGTARGHYFWQDLWAARKIFRRRPGTHVDVASRVDGFVAHLLTFMPVTYVDIRPVQDPVDGLTVLQDDLTELRCLAPRSVESLSCLHAVEHVGLGRYGDRIAPDHWKLAIASLTSLAPGELRTCRYQWGPNVCASTLTGCSRPKRSSRRHGHFTWHRLRLSMTKVNSISMAISRQHPGCTLGAVALNW
jgi:hypothetical protein